MASQTDRAEYNKYSAFIIEEASLRHLAGIIASTQLTAKYTVHYSSNLVSEYDAIEDIIELPNTSASPIVKLAIKGADTVGGVSLEMKVDADTSKPNTCYSISGDRRGVVLLKQNLDEWFTEIKPWYSRFSLVNFGTAAVIALLGSMFAFILLLTIPMMVAFLSGQMSFWYRLDLMRAVLIIGAILIVSSLIIAAVKPRMFPVGTFAIGYGVKRLRNAESLRNMIGSGVILAALVNVFVALLMAASGS